MAMSAWGKFEAVSHGNPKGYGGGRGAVYASATWVDVLWKNEDRHAGLFKFAGFSLPPRRDGAFKPYLISYLYIYEEERE